MTPDFTPFVGWVIMPVMAFLEISEEEVAVAYVFDEKQKIQDTVVALIRVLATQFFVPEQVKSVMRKLQDGSNPKPWVVIEIIPTYDWIVKFNKSGDKRELGVDMAFGRLNEPVTEYNFAKVGKAMADFVHEGSLCVDGHKEWADDRRDTFLEVVKDEMAVRTIAEAVRAQFITNRVLA